jgi:hypothetical protein
MNRKRILGTMLGALLLAFSAGATTLKRMNLDELTDAASVVARVRCLAVEADWENGQIWTFTTFEVLELIKGNVPRQITVRLIGGKVGHLFERVEGVPRFMLGEEVYLFLEPHQMGELAVTSWVQGTFRLRRDVSTKQESVTQDTGGVTIFDPTTRQYRPGGVRNMPVEEFRQHVRAAVERQRTGRQP